MICPKCGEGRAMAIHTVQSGGNTNRIRKCRGCHYSFNTVESPDLKTLTEKEKAEYEEYLKG